VKKVYFEDIDGGSVHWAEECISKAIDCFEKCEAEVYLKQAKEALESLK
jgi:hypothetical protein